MFTVRLTPEDRALLKAAAAASRLTLSEFVRRAALAASSETLAEAEAG